MIWAPYTSTSMTADLSPWGRQTKNVGGSIFPAQPAIAARVLAVVEPNRHTAPNFEKVTIYKDLGETLTSTYTELPRSSMYDAIIPVDPTHG